MERIGGRVDSFTKEMLRVLVEIDGFKEGKSSETKVLTDLIRKEHRAMFPDEYDSAGIWKDYKYMKQPA